MSSVDTIIQELNAGKEAQALVPQLREELGYTRRDLEQALAHSQGLELSIINYKEQIASLNDKVRSLEVERDDYGFRHIQATDTVEKLRAVLSTLGLEVSNALKASEPEPMPQPEPVSNTEPRDLAPQVHVSNPVDANVHTGTGWYNEPVAAEQAPPTLHPEPLAESKPQPYAGKLYYDHPSFVTENEWLAGGGDHQTYTWRPGDPMPWGVSRPIGL